MFNIDNLLGNILNGNYKSPKGALLFDAMRLNKDEKTYWNIRELKTCFIRSFTPWERWAPMKGIYIYFYRYICTQPIFCVIAS